MNAHWQGNDPAEVQAYWAYKLRGTSHRGVVYAMANLPQYAPTVDEFIQIANQAPEPYVAQLDYTESAEEREERQAKAQARIADIRAKFPNFRKPVPVADEQGEAA